jgi:hypothetical protein
MSDRPITIGAMSGVPATRRDRPYIWATWLAALLAGPKCGWQLWFRANHVLRTKQPDDPDAPMWRARHEELVDALDAEVLSTGVVTERELELKITFEDGVAIKGSADLVATHGDSGAIDIYEVKGGWPQESDRFQLWMYMWMMAETLDPDEVWDIGGWVVRKDERERYDDIPPDFADAVERGIATLSGPTALERVPGSHCRFCPITKVDCPVRQD